MGSIKKNICIRLKMFMPPTVLNIRNVPGIYHFRGPHVTNLNTFTTTVRYNFKFEYPPTTHRDIKSNIPKIQDAKIADHSKSDHLPSSRAIERNKPSIPLYDAKASKSQDSKIKSTYTRKNFSPVEDSLIIAYVKKLR